MKLIFIILLGFIYILLRYLRKEGKIKLYNIIIILLGSIIIFSICFIINMKKYELEILGVDSYIYTIEIYNNKNIYVTKKEQQMYCIQAPCPSTEIDRYKVKFDYNTVDYIYTVIGDIYLSNPSYNNYISIKDINKLDDKEKSVIEGIIYNDQKYFLQYLTK